MSSFRWHPTNAPVASSRTDDIWFLSPRVGWAVNSNGQILKTSDGGDSWVQQFQDQVYLRCIGLANEQRGWAGTLTAGKTLYDTSDGQTWSPVQNLPALAPPAICGLSVVSDQVVYASGTNFPNDASPARVMRTLDGGATWEGREMGEFASNLIDCYFTSPDTGWVVGGFSAKANPDYQDVKPVVLFTEDGGKSWVNRVADIQSQFPVGEWGWKIQFLTPEIGFVSLENFKQATILKTTDGGRTWTRLPVDDPQENANIEGVGFIDESTGWVGGWGSADFSKGYSSATTDGGRSWTDANEIGKNINRFRFLGDPLVVGYASGRTVYKYSAEPAPARVAGLEAPFMLQTIDRTVGTLPLKIPYLLSYDAERVRLQLWNQFGLEVACLLDIKTGVKAGKHMVTWDGTDDDGKKVDPGIYIYRLTVDGVAESKMVRIR